MKELNLDDYKREKAYEIEFKKLPEVIKITDYALEKAFKISELVKEIHGTTCEWYAFDLGKKDAPEIIEDIGIGKNNSNHSAFTDITPEEIYKFKESLPDDWIINGWTHSHANLGFKQFSGTDKSNMYTVNSFIAPLLKSPIGKREIKIKDISLLLKDSFNERDLEKGSVAIITDKPVNEVKILETIYGAFSYNIVIGDEGWHKQEIYYQFEEILSGRKRFFSKEAELEIIETGRKIDRREMKQLKNEIKEKIKPFTPVYVYKPKWRWPWKKKKKIKYEPSKRKPVDPGYA